MNIEELLKKTNEELIETRAKYKDCYEEYQSLLKELGCTPEQLSEEKKDLEQGLKDYEDIIMGLKAEYDSL